MMSKLHDKDLRGIEHDPVATSVESLNMRYGIVHGSFFQMATAFADPNVIIPIFLVGFTNSRVLIGLVVSLVGAMGIFPQIAIADYLRYKPNSAKCLMLIGIWIRCAVWGGIAFLTLTIADPSVLSLVLFMVGVSIYSLGGGVAVLPFKQVISESIATRRRSSFFGWRLFCGGVLSVFAGLIVKYVLEFDGMMWPQNYGILFLLSFISLGIAYIAMSRLHFSRISPQPETSDTPFSYELKRIWKEYPILKRLIVVRLLSGGLMLVLPFLTLYAIKDVGISLAWVGMFIMAQKGGVIVSNLVWMPLGNRIGTRSVILSGFCLAILSLATILWTTGGFAMAIAFVLAGAAMSAMTVGFNGYILEIGKSAMRPALFALEGTLLMPLYFMPLLGGLITDLYGYEILMLLGICLLFIGLIVAATLCEPRKNDPSCGPCGTLSFTQHL